MGSKPPKSRGGREDGASGNKDILRLYLLFLLYLLCGSQADLIRVINVMRRRDSRVEMAPSTYYRGVKKGRVTPDLYYSILAAVQWLISARCGDGKVFPATYLRMIYELDQVPDDLLDKYRRYLRQRGHNDEEPEDGMGRAVRAS